METDVVLVFPEAVLSPPPPPQAASRDRHATMDATAALLPARDRFQAGRVSNTAASVSCRGSGERGELIPVTWLASDHLSPPEARVCIRSTQICMQDASAHTDRLPAPTFAPGRYIACSTWASPAADGPIEELPPALSSSRPLRYRGKHRVRSTHPDSRNGRPSGLSPARQRPGAAEKYRRCRWS